MPAGYSATTRMGVLPTLRLRNLFRRHSGIRGQYNSTPTLSHTIVCATLSIKQQRPEHAVHARRPIWQSGFSRHHA